MVPPVRYSTECLCKALFSLCCFNPPWKRSLPPPRRGPLWVMGRGLLVTGESSNSIIHLMSQRSAAFCDRKPVQFCPFVYILLVNSSFSAWMQEEKTLLGISKCSHVIMMYFYLKYLIKPLRQMLTVFHLNGLPHAGPLHVWTCPHFLFLCFFPLFSLFK